MIPADTAKDVRRPLHVEFRHIHVRMLDEDCFPVIRRYADPPNLRLDLWVSVTDEPMARVSSNLRDLVLPDDEILVKDYSENKGIVPLLQAAGVLGECLRKERLTGMPIHRLLLTLSE